MTGVRRFEKILTALFRKQDENIILGTAIDLVPLT